MNDDELKAIDQRLAKMSERVEAVIEKESRGKRMPVLKPRPKAKYMPLDELREEYIQHAAQANAYWQGEKDSIEQIFAEFERQFDEMAEAHRR